MRLALLAAVSPLLLLRKEVDPLRRAREKCATGTFRNPRMEVWSNIISIVADVLTIVLAVIALRRKK